MSNKLKRKSKTPKRIPLNESQSIDRKFAEHCYTEIFTSFQLVCFAALYSSVEDGGFDFSKKKLQNFNKFLSVTNRAEIEKKISARDMNNELLKWGFDCEEHAKLFPYRAKMRMIFGEEQIRDIRKIETARVAADTAIKTYLLLAVYTLKHHYKVSLKKINIWWDKMVEVGSLYSKGMTDQFVIDFIRDDCGLVIAR